MPQKYVVRTVEDQETRASLSALLSRKEVESNRYSGVRTILFVLSSKALPYDVEALRHKAVAAYPDAAVFFVSTSGIAYGVQAPRRLDLVVDFTGPGQRQPFFYARKLKARAKRAVGRKAGFFRTRLYDRVFDEKAHAAELPKEFLAYEREVQKHVLALAGISAVPAASATPDLGKNIALSLPPLVGAGRA